MSNSTGTNWRFLIIEDKEVFVRELLEALPSFVDPPDSAEAEVVESFKDATTRMKEAKFDILILDLKDDSNVGLDADSNPAGLKTFETLRTTRFVPVVFYTALAHKVRSQETSFVRVVEKTEGIGRVKEEVRRVFETQLPALTRQVEEVQRSYMWEFVTTHWKQFTSPRDQADLAYLLARRLALSLEGLAAKLAVTVGGPPELPSTERQAHPMMMYVRPPLGPHRLAGDILVEKIGAEEFFWLVVTPSCDFAQDKARHFVLAKCERLTEQEEYKGWSKTPNKDSKSRMEDLISDYRRFGPSGSKLQPERFKFLPGTFFLPDLVADFQQLRSVSIENLAAFEAVASLDSPFAEAVISRFVRYFARLGTPDIDRNVVLNRLQAALKESTANQGGSVPGTSA